MQVNKKKAPWAVVAAVVCVVAGGVEQSMLLGNGLAVKEMIRGLGAQVPGVEVRVFDPWGAPVFGETPPAPRPDAMPASVREALSTGARHATHGGRVFRPMPNEARCSPCHDATRAVRGVLELVPSPAGHPAHIDAPRRSRADAGRRRPRLSRHDSPAATGWTTSSLTRRAPDSSASRSTTQAR
jgi:hypothetical protein